jgi:hypothetical protein
MLATMDLERIFADLDGVHWAGLEHAYGEAEDVPGMLRALAGGGDGASDALVELWGSVIHQGTVYGATVEAVPFLARLAAAGVLPAELLALVGAVADSDDEYRLPAPGACRAAAAAALPLILPLAAGRAPDRPDGAPEDTGPGEETEERRAEVRRTAVWAAGRTGDPSALPVLRERWVHERHPGVRAELLAAIALLDPAGAVALLDGVLGAAAGDGGAPPGTGALSGTGAPATAEAPEVVIVALLALVDSGAPWTPAHRDALLALLPGGPLVSGRFDEHRAEPLRYAVGSLLLRDTDLDRDAAYGLAAAALRLPAPEAVEEAISAAEQACLISRSAPGRLAGPLLALFADPASPHTARLLPVLGGLGPRAAPAVPGLAALAAGEGDTADRALAILVRLDPERSGRLLARGLGDRSRSLAEATGRRGGGPGPAVPYAPELLNAIRIELTALAAADDLRSPAAGRLTAILAGWGQRAAAALPEVTVLFRRAPGRFARVLASVCPPESRESTAGLLRAAAALGPAGERCAAAEALRALTGETGPLLEALGAVLASGPEAEQVSLAGELGTEGAVLVPELRAALTPAGVRRSVPELRTDTALALSLGRLTGEPAEAVKIVGEVLAEAAEGTWTRRAVREGCEAAVRLGPAARELIPVLESVLVSAPRHSAPAVTALAALGAVPAGAAGLMLGLAERDEDPEGALEALESLGTQDLGVEDLRRLRALAERDLRVVASGLEPEIVRKDERFRSRAARLLAD